RKLLQLGVKTAVVKCGEKGCVIGDADGIRRIPAYSAAKCVDTTGAGDTFVSGFLWACAEGMPVDACARFACAAASVAVEHIGAAGEGCSLEEIWKRYHREQDPAFRE
ncbi:MAG: PfkB family carbohydrate kinase, partial [Bacillota bacterium]|nr:PfkB family carbohydrate kinase [Bacillota bacterium]